jgi:hypothetical protein
VLKGDRRAESDSVGPSAQRRRSCLERPESKKRSNGANGEDLRASQARHRYGRQPPVTAPPAGQHDDATSATTRRAPQ